MEGREKKRLRKLSRGIWIASIALMGLALFFGASLARFTNKIIREQFSEQQMVLARSTALTIERSLQNAVDDLHLLNSLASLQYKDSYVYRAFLLSIFSVLARDDIMEIRQVDREGATLFVVNDEGIAMKPFDATPHDPGIYLVWASDVRNCGKIMATATRPGVADNGKTIMTLDLVLPSYQDCCQEREDQVSHRFEGYLTARLDISHLLQKILEPVTSGENRYAWVMDGAGNFLYHPAGSFIGKNAFAWDDLLESGSPAQPGSRIQRSEMLGGKAGIGIYVSSRPGDSQGPTRKLIAFTPVRMQSGEREQLWSVAVLSPVSRMESILDSLLERRIQLQGAVLFLLMLVTLSVVLYQARWSRVLEDEVTAKTNDIRNYARELERSEAKYRSLVEGAEDLIFTLDEKGVIQTANHYMSKFCGVEGSSLAGRTLRDLLAERVDEQLELVRKVFQSGFGERAEVWMEVRGKEHWFHIQYIPLDVDAEAGRPRLVLSIARDITDRKLLEKKLVRTEKLAAVGTLAAGVAHEINNPLGIMLGFCDLLLEEKVPGTPEYNDLKIIERHGLQCKSIVERLLYFAGTGETGQESCDLNASVEAVVSTTQPPLNKNNIELVTSLSKGLPPVRGDSKGIQLVLFNLVSNAASSMNGKGRLTVETRLGEENGWVEAVIKDTGCGIRSEDLQKIFDPFFTGKEVGSGAGLGLSVAYGIVRKYGGTIECASSTREESGEPSGTVFTIRLPIEKTCGSSGFTPSSDSPRTAV
jgi:PAS domain S-box-containing protein